jgi:RNA polymerase sigma-70 factor (ECF subfamily)
MSGSLHDADDLLQESLIRAWKGLNGFEGRASLRTWLYKVATNVCLDALGDQAARTLPMELGPAVESAAFVGAPELDPIWIEPCPEELYAEAPASPEARYSQREAVALAFLVALQLLPAKQRAALILREVIGLQAMECAEILQVSVPAVKSALQRARETLASRAATMRELPPAIDDAATRALLARYAEAWERADVAALVSVLHDDAVLTMPPYRQWLRGASVIAAGVGSRCVAARAGVKMVAIRANGQPACAMYSRDAESGSFLARGIHVIQVRGERIAGVTAFVDGSLFERFGLPARL